MGTQMSESSETQLIPPPGSIQHSDRDLLNRLLSTFLAQQNVAEITRLAYRRNLRSFLRWHSEVAGRIPLSREAVLSYKAWLLTEGYRATTISNYLSAVRLLFAWASENGLAPNIADGVTGSRQSRTHRKDPLTAEQVVRLLASMPTATLLDARNFAITTLAVHTGLRTIELVRGNVNDIRTRGDDTLLWVHGKGRDDADEFVVLTEATLVPIMRYLTRRGHADGNEPLFANPVKRGSGARLSTRTIRRMIKDALRTIDINSPRISAHSLRHTAITLALQEGASLVHAKEMARHRNVATTMLYAHNLNRIEEAAEKKVAQRIQRRRENDDAK